jgi:hypothetical protein
MNCLRLQPFVLTLMGVTSLFAPSELKAIDIKIENASVSSVVQLLRTQECAAISFIEAAQSGTVSLSFERATVAEILSEVVRQDTAYRSETLGGRDVLYPAAPEFQAVVGDVEIQPQPRQAATELYVDLLRNAVPAFSDLVPPVLFGDDRMPIYSDKVTLRSKGRVIEHFVDLLGKDQDLYFAFIEARSGAPSLEFERATCTSTFSPGRRHPSDHQGDCQGSLQIGPVFDGQGALVSNQFLAHYQNEGTESAFLPSLCGGLCLLVDGEPHQRGGWQGWGGFPDLKPGRSWDSTVDLRSFVSAGQKAIAAGEHEVQYNLGGCLSNVIQVNVEGEQAQP